MGKKKKDPSTKSKQVSIQYSGDLIWVDPAWIRFQHARIRPTFSSCGRTLLDTLNSIRSGDISPFDLPTIQVLAGPEAEHGRWYFSLNNRRLWVLKRCREEGLLSSSNNEIPVHVRSPKSQAEVERYSIENCSLEAKVMREKAKNTRDIIKSSSRSLIGHEEALCSSDNPNELNGLNAAGVGETNEDCNDDENDDDETQTELAPTVSVINRFRDLP